MAALVLEEDLVLVKLSSRNRNAIKVEPSWNLRPSSPELDEV
jgi:hypothetical protein